MSASERRDQWRGFGPWLQSWRSRRRLTQEALARRLGYDVTYIRKIEGGTRQPSKAFLARLAQETGYSEDALLRARIVDMGRPELPGPPGLLVGRGDDVPRLIELLTGSTRCLTLTGPPGIGKTRLALDVARSAQLAFLNGAWWVSLLDVTRAEDVAPQVLRALGGPDHPEAGEVEGLLKRLRGQQALLVLDNFEHVIYARNVVSSLISGAPDVTVLITSREALGLLGETVVVVRPLRWPDATARSLEDIRSAPAVQLFEARARMSDSEFRLSANCGEVAKLCALLEGNPLAIVLAAAGVRTIGLGGLVGHLVRAADEREFPAVAPTDMPRHHQSLETAIAWSWELLPPEGRQLLETVSVFSGGFTALSAATVHGLPTGTTADLLVRLSHKSLLEPQPDAGGGARFELLEMIRAFGAAELARSGMLDEVRRRHFERMLDIAERSGRLLVGAEQVASVRILTDEYQNVARAFEWANEHDPAGALRLAVSIWRFFVIADIPTGRRWLAAALAAAPDPVPARAEALAALGALGWLTGHAQDASQTLSEAARLAHQLGLAHVAALVLVNQAAIAGQQTRLDDAEGLFSRALSIYDELDDDRGRGVALNGLGMVRRQRGEVGDAWPLWTESAALFRRVGDKMNLAIALGNKAWAAEVDGRLDEAIALSMECREIQARLGDVRGLAATTAALGRIAARRGNNADATALHLDALEAFQRVGDLPWTASTLLSLAGLAQRAGNPQRALTLLTAAKTVWTMTGTNPVADEEELRDQVAVACRSVLPPAAVERAIGDGESMTVAEVVVFAGVPEATA